MDNSLNYADIIQNTLKEATKDQPRIQSIQLYPICDRDSGHFLILATGWDKRAWINTILFHAHLIDREVTIEEDNFEEGLTSTLFWVEAIEYSLRKPYAKLGNCRRILCTVVILASNP